MPTSRSISEEKNLVVAAFLHMDFPKAHLTSPSQPSPSHSRSSQRDDRIHIPNHIHQRTNHTRRQTRPKHKRTRQYTNLQLPTRQHNRSLDRTSRRPREVIAIPTGLVAVDAARHIRRPRTQRLEDIKFPAPIGVAPARTRSVLLRPRNQGVQQPDSGLIRGTRAWHCKFQQEYLFGAPKTMICRYPRSIISTSPSGGGVGAARLGGHEDDFVVVEEDVLQGLRGRCGGGAGGGGVGEGGAEEGGPDPGGAGAGAAAHVVEEDEVGGCAGGGGVVGLLGPGCTGGSWGGAGGGCGGGGTE